MIPTPKLDPQALAALTYHLAEVLGAQAPVVRLLKRAAETADAEVAAEAWDAFLALPAPCRADVARLLAPARATEAARAARDADTRQVLALFGRRPTPKRQ